MKYLLSLFILTCLIFNSYAQENVIWGVWNVGDIQYPESVFNDDLGNDGTFINTRGLQTLIFRSDYYGSGPLIYEHGYSYAIKEIIFNENNTVSLYIETKLISYHNHPLVNAKIVMYFLEQDSVWMELDRNDEQYPTDPRFPDAPFHRGREVVYWRTRVTATNDNTPIPDYSEDAVIDNLLAAGDNNEDIEDIIHINNPSKKWFWFILLLISLVIIIIFVLSTNSKPPQK
jgi:hypothetical protein